jgi:hypothetical protein
MILMYWVYDCVLISIKIDFSIIFIDCVYNDLFSSIKIIYV